MTDAFSVFLVIALVWMIALPFLAPPEPVRPPHPVTADRKERILVQLEDLEADLRSGKIEREEYISLKDELLREAAKVIS